MAVSKFINDRHLKDTFLQKYWGYYIEWNNFSNFSVTVQPD